jgi:hypothetical protein
MKYSLALPDGSEPAPRKPCQKHTLQHKANLGYKPSLGIRGQIHACRTDDPNRYPYIKFSNGPMPAYRVPVITKGKKKYGQKKAEDASRKVSIECDVPQNILARNKFFWENAIVTTVRKV